MIYKNFNRPKFVRFIERIYFHITKKPHTLGIMQVRTKKLIDDKTSIVMAIDIIKNATLKHKIKVKKDKYYIIIVELFDKGNIILLDDENNIILPLKRIQQTDRDISSKKEYVFPKEKILNPLTISEDEFKKIFKESDSDIVRTLARNGLGSLYAEEIIERANEIIEVDKNTPNNEITEEQLNGLYKGWINLFDNLKDESIKPQIVKNNSKEDVVPINLVKYTDYEKTFYETF